MRLLLLIYAMATCAAAQVYVAFEGDSITDPGSTIGMNQHYPHLVSTFFGAATTDYVNYAGAAFNAYVPAKGGSVVCCTVSGWDATLNMTYRIASVEAYFTTGQPIQILSILIGRNDMVAGGPGQMTPVVFTANLKTYCQTFRAAKPTVKIVILSILPSVAAGFNASRNAANSLIAADPSFYDLFVPGIAADSTIGCDGCAANSTYYVDGTHPTAAGHVVIAPYVEAAIEQLIAPPASTVRSGITGSGILAALMQGRMIAQ